MNSIQQARKEINWKTSTSIINTIGFLAYALDEHNFSYTNLLPHHKKSIRYSAILLAIASFHYAILDINKPSVTSELIIRYSDWLLTTPLLLLVLTSFYNLDDSISIELVVYNLIMIIFGFFYEMTGNMVLWSIGTFAYIAIVIRLWIVLPEKDLLYSFFIGGWSLYGVIALLPRQKRFIYFNLLDCYNKLIFAMVIRNKILNHS